jgi:hypothetical protein
MIMTLLRATKERGVIFSLNPGWLKIFGLDSQNKKMIA